MDWTGELEFLTSFAKDLEEMPELPLASSEALDSYALDSARLQDLLGLIRSLPPGERPPAGPWDDVLGPLWRRFFSRGDDISRYILANLWSDVLLEAGETERYLRTLTARVASARNFYLYKEALELVREGRKATGGKPSPVMTNLVNTEGSVYYCLKDWDSAESRFREALAMAELLPDGDDWKLFGLSRQDIIGQEIFNITELSFEKGLEAPPAQRLMWAKRGADLLGTIATEKLGPSFFRILSVSRAELAILREDYSTARKEVAQLLEGEDLEGPYRYPVLATHHRLMARIASCEGNAREAYDWVRKALKVGVRYNYPMEEHLVLEEAFHVLKELYAHQGDRAGRYLVEDLVQLLEEKDWYTGRSHSRNVSHLAKRIGRALSGSGRPLVDLDLLETAGLVHDIGKLRIPWSLLNKIAPITPKERLLLQSHSGHGESMLKSIGMPDVAEVVGQHHETMDGSGYPRGMAPDLHAAVVGLCDVFQASIEPNRRYKKPKTVDESLHEIRSMAGSRYHPQVVEALMRVAGTG